MTRQEKLVGQPREISWAATGSAQSGVGGPLWRSLRPAVEARNTLHLLAAQQMPARHEQIGQRAGHEQTMGVFLQPAIAQLGKAEHPLDDADRMFDPGPHFGLVRFRPLDLIETPRWR